MLSTRLALVQHSVSASCFLCLHSVLQAAGFALSVPWTGRTRASPDRKPLSHSQLGSPPAGLAYPENAHVSRQGLQIAPCCPLVAHR